MWITAWILVGVASLYQPAYPPFATRDDCEAAKRVFLRGKIDSAAECIQAKVFVNAQR